MEYDDMRAVLRDYNWDDGFGLPGRLLDQPGCDLALALEIFYLADGFAFLSDSEGKSGSKEWRDFISRLYDKIEQGRYPKENAAFAVPLNRVIRYKLRKKRVPEIFLEDIGITEGEKP